MTKTPPLKSVRLQSPQFLLLVAAFCLAGFLPAGAQTIITKADTATMNSAADWGGTPPDGTTIGLFDSTLATQYGSLTLGGPVALRGMIFTNTLAGAVTIGSDGNTLTNGSAGIDASSANQGITLNCDLNLNAAQTWNIGDNVNTRLFYLGGALSGTSPTLNLATNVVFSFQSAANNTVSVANAGGAIIKSINTTGIPTLSQADGFHWIKQINGSSGCAINLNGTANSTNYCISQFNTPSMRIKMNSGTWNHIFSGEFSSDLELNGGTFINTNTANWWFTQSGGTGKLTVHGGSLVASNSFGLRMGNSFGANGSGYSYTTVQDGGLVRVAASSAGLELGNNSANTLVTYTLSGGTLAVDRSASYWLQIGAATTGSGSTTLTLTNNGKLRVIGGIRGVQTPGAAQVFDFAGGTLHAATVDMTKLGSAAAPTVYGTLYNNGGKLAPGDVGVPGRTIITGNYTVSSPTATLAIDIGGTGQSSAFEDTSTTAKYDFVQLNASGSWAGTATLGGLLTANLINGYVPASSSTTFNILTAAGGIVGTGTNIGYSGYVPVTVNGTPNNKYFQALVVGSKLYLTNYGVALPALVAGFTPTNSVGTAPLPVTFTDTSSGAITNRHWNFGDSSTLDTLSTTVNHTFTNLGIYTVILTIKGLDGSSLNSTGKVSVVVPGGDITWTGVNSSAWDLTTTNWVNNLLQSVGYADADGVIFDDTSSRTNVVLNRTAAPNGVTFNNTSKTYTVSGTGKISAGTGLSVNGSGGTVVLLTANDYSGLTTVASGATLQLGNGTTSGSVDGTSGINNDGSLVVNTPDNHTVNGPVNGNGSLTKNGNGTFAMPNGVLNGSVTVGGGVFSTTDYTNIPSVSTLSVSNGGVFQFTAGPSSGSATVSMASGGGGINHLTPLTMNSGQIIGAGPFKKGGSGTMTFAYDFTSADYTGSTIVNGGALQLGQSSPSGAVPAGVVLNGGSLVVDRGDTYVPSPITGSSGASSITLKSTPAGSTNVLELADGVNTFGDINNNCSADLILNSSANSTNTLAGPNGLIGNNGTTLWVNGGIYIQSAAGLRGVSGGTLIINGGDMTAVVGAGQQGNLVVSNGALRVLGDRLNFQNDGQSFTVAGGLVYFTNGLYGLRMGASGGNAKANDVNSKNFTGTQSGGAVVVNTGNSATGVELGGLAASKTATYDLNGGTFNVTAPSGLWIGADTNGTSTSRFTLASPAKLSVAGSMGGGTGNNANSVAVFSFQSGTLVLNSYDATTLRDAATSPVGTLANYGGILAPGDVGIAGKTSVTGNYAVSNSTAVLDMDIGGTTAANFYQTNAAGYYDKLAVSGSVQLGGNLVLRLINGFEPLTYQANSFTIVTGSSLSGAFANVASGSRLAVSGYPNRSFRVTVNATSVVLDQYQTDTPQAYFTQNSNLGTNSLTVTFTNLSNGSGLTNLWSFGDGNTSTSTSPTVSHTYSSVGTNTVSLTVGSALGVSSYIRTNSVIVVAQTTPTSVPITYTANNGQLILNWPNGQGWVLQSQTNNLSTGLGTNWVPVAGVTSPFTNNVNPANGSVFYRLVYP